MTRLYKFWVKTSLSLRLTSKLFLIKSLLYTLLWTCFWHLNFLSKPFTVFIANIKNNWQPFFPPKFVWFQSKQYDRVWTLYGLYFTNKRINKNIGHFQSWRKRSILKRTSLKVKLITKYLIQTLEKLVLDFHCFTVKVKRKVFQWTLLARDVGNVVYYKVLSLFAT